ncbi:unnamed protein product [Dovyalis caffra]|uniref:Uncharacterized protein n=1 Tax=Dovyalis caffra TaxID=77055 RepID=A0AAV1SJ84_9ROSI|nr:unnamed protein product [Dovyalis caffra]
MKLDKYSRFLTKKSDGVEMILKLTWNGCPPKDPLIVSKMQDKPLEEQMLQKIWQRKPRKA